MKTVDNSFIKTARHAVLQASFALTFILTVCLLIGGVSSCSKDDSSGGAPQITGLRAISPAPADSKLTLVLPGQNVIIQGRNFKGVQSVYFDGVEASVNTALNTDHSIVLSVPTTIIFPKVAPEDLNKIKVVTLGGTAEYSFAVSPPPPVVSSISNEFAAAGSKLTIKGAYLFTVSQVVFPGGITLNSGFVSAEDGSVLTVNVPAGVTGFSKADSIQINTVGGTCKAAFHNNYGIVANFETGDPDFGWQQWGGIHSNDAGVFAGGWGYYIEIKPQNAIKPGDGSWWGDNRAVMVDAHAPWPGVDITATPNKYALKFEMSVNGVWKDGALAVVINGDFNHIARVAPWEVTPGYTTNGWVTVILPLNTFLSTSTGTYDAGGSPPSNVSALTGGKSDATIQIMLLNDGATALSPFDAAFDNVRVVKMP